MSHIQIALALISCIALVQSTPFEKCSGKPAPLNLRIKGCDQLPCKLRRGTDVSAEWDFVVTSNTNVLKPKVRAYVMGIGVDYPLDQKDACTTLTNAECPLDKDEEVTYALTMPVLSSYPPIKLKIQFSFVDDNDKVQVCFAVPAKVT